MTSPAAPSQPGGTGTSTSSPTSISVLLYSNDRSVRDLVRVAVGDHPAEDVVVERWQECATADMTLMEAHAGGYDLLILDGESQPYGGMGVCRQLKNELFRCPPVLVLTGRPGDGWLATWSQADAVLSRPLDEARLTAAVTDLARR
ncbi:hypothetical protein ACI3EY_05120 [Ornithinimicrobium sp. LYQ92]|uniref:hypothetical protein n=1 Tax=Serinicoccus sp. LYQ92 TaxID=3378798 RepID=UPI003851C711